MSTTVIGQAKRIKGRIGAPSRNEVHSLASNLNGLGSQAVVLTLTPGSNLISGALICIDAEAMRVAQVDPGTKTLTVLRGYYDTDMVAHTAGTEVEVDSRFATFRIVDAIMEELGSWGDKIFRVVSAEVAIADGTETIELPAALNGAIGLLSVRRKSSNSSTAWPSVPVRIQRAASSGWSGSSGNGVLLRFTNDGGSLSAGTLIITAALPLAVSTFDLSTDLLSVGVPRSAFDVLSLGTRIRLLLDAELASDSRDIQDDAMRPGERPPYQWATPLQAMNALYRRRLQEEADRLRSLYPMEMMG